MEKTTEMKNKNRNLSIVLGVLIIIGICVFAVILMYFPQRVKAVFSRPLVLIHNPGNRTQLALGEGTIIHATARNQKGITRVELWVDGQFTNLKEAPEDSLTNPLVLTADWQPTTIGKHFLLVRALSTDGVYGQSSITIEAVESETLLESYIVEEGDTLESIADAHGVDQHELAEINPDIPSGGPAPGDIVDVPAGWSAGEPSALEDTDELHLADEPSADETELEPDDTGPESGDMVPVPDDTAPGTFTEIFELLFRFSWIDFFDAEADSSHTLYMEILGFETNIVYEDTNCYVSLAEGPWDVTDMRSAANTFIWPDDQPLPFDVTCVGIASGGTDSVELGSVAMRIPPEAWDGVVHRVASIGGEGFFNIDYRVSQGDLVEKDPDPDMTSPTNVRLDDRRNSLRWDYYPEEDEAPINGFRIYLNGNLQWTEPADSDESGLPYEWFNPICGSSYEFNVTAYRHTTDDIAESYPADIPVIVSNPLEGCTREVQVTFLTLETFDLGGDGRYEDRYGDIGPPYGNFYANERQVSFDARGSDSYWAGLDLAHGLSHNSIYDLFEMWGEGSWGFSGMPSIIVDLPPDGTFEFGYHIMDSDTGRCRDSDDPGCDDLICDGLSTTYGYDDYHYFDEWHESVFTSENGRCRVTYRLGPAFGSPVGSGIDGWEPLPWLEIEEIDIDSSTGRTQVHIRNTGTATWPWRDLDVAVQTRDGETIAIHTWLGFALDAGQSTVLEIPTPLEPPYDACVVIDPDDQVVEEYERSGALVHNPVCPDLADLTITDVHFDALGGGRLRVTIQNIGDGLVESRTLALKTLLPDGSSAYISSSWPNITLDPGARRTFDLIGVNESARERLSGGYSVVVNPDFNIPESNTDNNTFEVPHSAQLQLFWCNRNIPHQGGLTSAVRMYFSADIVAGETANQVLDDSWSHSLSGQEVRWGYGHNEYGFPGSWYTCHAVSENFEILGDENLRVNFRSTYRVGNNGDFENIGSTSYTWTSDRNWGAGMKTAEETYSSCSGTGGRHSISTTAPWGLGYIAWSTGYLVCEITP